ncbi:MAG: hypothetical protein R3Y46_03335 [Opitutales bacterium]
MKQNIVSKWIVPSSISAVAICLMLAFAPKIEMPKAYNFKDGNIGTNFINAENSSKIEALSLYDFEPIFLPTNYNIRVEAPRDIKVDSFKDINNVDVISSESYNEYVLNKKKSALDKLNNIFHSDIRELMPYYKVQDTQELLDSKEQISISVIDTKTGQEVASESLDVGEEYSSFFVPTEIFMSVGTNLDINIVDNISNPSLESSTTELIKESLNKTKIFNQLNAGYYKLIISP